MAKFYASCLDENGNFIAIHNEDYKYKKDLKKW